MNVVQCLQGRIEALLEAEIATGALPSGLDLSRFAIEPPREIAHGDLSTNAAMVYAREAKAAGSNPRALAQKLVEGLRREANIASVEVAGPGFINIRMQFRVYEDVLRAALRDPETYGRGAKSPPGSADAVWVGADPIGPLHFVHAREAAFSAALARLVAFAGQNAAAGGSPIAPAGPTAEMTGAIRNDLKALDVDHEVFSAESASSGAGGGPNPAQQSIAVTRARGVVREGRTPPARAPLQDRGDREQNLFRAADFGDAADRPPIEPDGGRTNCASDIACHGTGPDRGFTRLVDVPRAAHGGRVEGMQAGLAARGSGAAACEAKLCQPARLTRAGEPVGISKYSGGFVTLTEVVDEVGADAVRFIMLMRRNDAALDFDLAKAVERSHENPVFHVQYAHARTHSVLREGRAALPDLDLGAASLADADFSALGDESERRLMRAIADFPRVVSQAAGAREPHRVAAYAHDLATYFHSRWNQGNEHEYLRFVNENSRSLTQARLALVTATAGVLRSALAILGVSAPEEMC